MSKPTTITFNDIKVGSLFILPGVGVCRKTHPCQATEKEGRVRVVYPCDEVAELPKRK